MVVNNTTSTIMQVRSPLPIIISEMKLLVTKFLVSMNQTNSIKVTETS